MNTRGPLARLSWLSLFALLGLAVAAQTPEASPAKDGGKAATAPALPDSPALAAAKAALLPALAAKDFESQLGKAAAGLAPADAAGLDEFFAKRVASPALASKLYSMASSLRTLLGDFAAAAADSEAMAGSGAIGVTTDSKDSVPTEERKLGRETAEALLHAARLWLAAGETDRASQLAAVVITTSKDRLLIDEARLVAAWSSLLSGSPASALALAGILAAPASGPSQLAATDADRRDALRRESVFLLWAGSDAKARDVEAKRLAADWPGSPEAQIALGSSDVTLMALPHWYLGGVLLLPEEPPVETAQKPSDVSAAHADDAAGTKGGTAIAETPQTLRYQVGIFSSRDNAQALVDELRKKGFVAKIEARKIGSQSLLAVVLSQKDNKDRLDERLKDAGYEAWLLTD
ncbi:MAG TPA: SPOR domain-containing protein [Rectinemataceae bacterium]|nr:SPOR domain-containing protein [Rectinemataceae bacterium]